MSKWRASRKMAKYERASAQIFNATTLANITTEIEDAVFETASAGFHQLAVGHSNHSMPASLDDITALHQGALCRAAVELTLPSFAARRVKS